MKLGVCTGIENAEIIHKAGFDFIELNVQSSLIPEKPESEFRPLLEQIKAMPIPALAANVFFPGHIKVTGPDFNERQLSRHVETVCGRALRCGIQKIVFGSGGARRIPEGFSREAAQVQLIEFGKLAAHIASACGITIVVEPLNNTECNVLTSVGEGAEYVGKVDDPAFRLLVDLYHFRKDDNDYEALAKSLPLIHHAHIATAGNRKAPSLEPCDFSKDFKTLKAGGYDGTISIEGGWNDIAKEAAAAFKALKEAASV